MSDFWTVRILKICRTSGPDVMSGRALPGKLNTHNRDGDINSLVNFLPWLTMIFIAIAVMPNIGKIIWRRYSISQFGNTWSSVAEILKISIITLAIRIMEFSGGGQRNTYRVFQTIQMKLILLCAWAEPAVLGSTKTALKFKYEI